jgi:hypothetical protein
MCVHCDKNEKLLMLKQAVYIVTSLLYRIKHTEERFKKWIVDLEKEIEAFMAEKIHSLGYETV